MARKTLEEFYQSYEYPTVGEVVVGFSGIDPQKKTWTDTQTIPQPIKNEINETVRANLENQVIVFDSGEIQ